MLGHTLTCPVTVLRRKFNSSKLLATFSFSAFMRGFPSVFKHYKLNEKIEKKQTLDGETNHTSKEKAENRYWMSGFTCKQSNSGTQTPPNSANAQEGTWWKLLIPSLIKKQLDKVRASNITEAQPCCCPVSKPKHNWRCFPGQKEVQWSLTLPWKGQAAARQQTHLMDHSSWASGAGIYTESIDAKIH